METQFILGIWIAVCSLLMLDLYDGHRPSPTLAGAPLAAALIIALAILGAMGCLIPRVRIIGLVMLAVSGLILLPVEGKLRKIGFNPALYRRDRQYLANIISRFTRHTAANR